MKTSVSHPPVTRFGVFELDLQSKELRKQGMKLRLQGQPVEILALLLERPGEVISREELQKRLWPADTFVDFEQGLNNAMKRLRVALHDDAESPHFIETLPKRGYRFIGETKRYDRLVAPVEAINESVAADPIPAIQTVPQTSITPRKHRLAILAAVSGLVLIFGLLILFNVGILRERLRRSKVPEIHSLAVLPLRNLSGDQGQEYFADAMTEELITELSRIGALRVISQTSVMRYRQTDKPLPEIARELNVDGIVEGSVLRSGDRVRINAQLIYAPTDTNLWAQTYDRDLRDVLTLQSTVAGTIADEIRVQMSPQQISRFKTVRPVNRKALDAYLEGPFTPR